MTDEAMPSIAIFYGSSTGNTQEAAEKIQQELGDFVHHVADVVDSEPSDLESYDILLLGVSTWNIGEMQEDWDSFIPNMSGLDLSGKKIAFFAMGDQAGYPDNFLDAMGQLWKAVKELGNPELVVSGQQRDTSSMLQKAYLMRITLLDLDLMRRINLIYMMKESVPG
jgi:flavodoxin long chain